MLLVPVEDRGDWRRPPLLIIALVLTNLLVHLQTQRAWFSEEQQPAHYLDDSQIKLLVEREWPLLLDWLGDRRPQLWLEIHEAEGDDRLELLRGHGWRSARFNEFVHRYWQDHAPGEAWRSARAAIEQWRANLPVIRHGLIPDRIKPLSLLTHMFMHGGWGHLFGNMIFLLLFGVPMERHWGALRLLPLYLLSGLGAAGLFIALNPDSDTPLVGASGAIAGLMGIYCTSYGLRRIEFFYTLGFLFGSFRAPAFAVFPLWIAKELLQSMLTGGAVAYMAHVGGLLTGAAVTLLARRFRTEQADEDNTAAAPGPGADNARQARNQDRIPASIERQTRAFNFDQALDMARNRLEEDPDWPALWAFSLEQAPNADYSRQQALLQLALRKRHAGEVDDTLVARVWHKARHWPEGGRQLAPAATLVLAEVLAREGETGEALGLARGLRERGFAHARLARLLDQLESSGIG